MEFLTFIELQSDENDRKYKKIYVVVVFYIV